MKFKGKYQFKSEAVVARLDQVKSYLRLKNQTSAVEVAEYLESIGHTISASYARMLLSYLVEEGLAASKRPKSGRTVYWLCGDTYDPEEYFEREKKRRAAKCVVRPREDDFWIPGWRGQKDTLVSESCQ